MKTPKLKNQPPNTMQVDKPQEDTKAQGEKLQVQEMNPLDGQGEVTEEINQQCM